jgi:hypothetical protein
MKNRVIILEYMKSYALFNDLNYFILLKLFKKNLISFPPFPIGMEQVRLEKNVKSNEALGNIKAHDDFQLFNSSTNFNLNNKFKKTVKFVDEIEIVPINNVTEKCIGKNAIKRKSKKHMIPDFFRRIFCCSKNNLNSNSDDDIPCEKN